MQGLLEKKPDSDRYFGTEKVWAFSQIGPQSNKAYAMGKITNKYILDRHYSSQEQPGRPSVHERAPL